MNRARAIVVLLVVGLVGYVGWRAWPRGEGRYLSGYVEGDTLYLSAPVSGAVTGLSVVKGQRVAAGAPLFLIDPRPTAAQREQAEAGLEAAKAQARDAEKGQRPQELAVIQAQRAEVAAQLRQARKEYDRVRVLAARGYYSQARLDQARAEFETLQAQARETSRRLDVAELGQRSDQIQAARARTVQAEGLLAETESRLSQLAPAAPADARVQDVFFQKGEWAPANQPVVALLPDDRVKLRFFVPQAEVARYRPGRSVRFTCDGCGRPMTAKIGYVSPTAEYTPPVIYSRESRYKLVFLVEAWPERPRALAVGQPVDVVPLGPESGSEPGR
jgi:HlyD family secretion protein